MRDKPTLGKFSVPEKAAGGVVEVLGEGRQLKVNNGTFEDQFKGYGVHLYRLVDGP